MANHDWRIDEIENWKDGVIAAQETNRLPERVRALEQTNLEPRVTKIERTQEDINVKLATVLRNQEEQKKEAHDITEISREVKNVRMWQTSYDKHQKHERLRLRRISADQENARREVLYQTAIARREADQRSDSLRKFIAGFGSAISIAFISPLAAQFVQSTHVGARDKGYGYIVIIAAIASFVVAIIIVYMRTRRTSATPLPPPPERVTVGDMVLGDEEEEGAP